MENTPNPVGRPSKMTPEAIKKLEEASALDASIPEVCFYAGISKETYYNWMQDNPELLDRLTELRNRPVLKARQSVIKGMEDNPKLALDYLERKRKGEFSPRTEMDFKDETALKEIEQVLKDLTNKHEPDSKPSLKPLQGQSGEPPSVNRNPVDDIRANLEAVLSQDSPDGSH